MTNWQEINRLEAKIEELNAALKVAAREIAEQREEVRRLKRGIAESITTLQNAACDTY